VDRIEVKRNKNFFCALKMATTKKDKIQNKKNLSYVKQNLE